MQLRINHETHFQYDVAPSYGLLQMRMVPKTNKLQRVLSWDVDLNGAREQVSFDDQHGNRVDLIEVMPDTEQLIINVSGTIETLADDGILGRHIHAMPLWFYRRQTALTRPDEAISKLTEGLPEKSEGELARFHALSRKIGDAVAYMTGQTDVSTTAADAVARAKGVCQDHAHIFLSVARLLGYPARYVSGYLMMNDRTDQDASHAWAEVHLDGLGWIGFDVSNGISPDQRYVRVAHGLDYSDVAPTKGIILGSQRENLIVSIQVQQ